jgi:hypothetical protein
MVTKLTVEVVHLKQEHAEFKVQTKDLQSLVAGPIGPSKNESYKDQFESRSFPLQSKTHKEAVVSRLQCRKPTTANNADIRSVVISSPKLKSGNNADGVCSTQSVSRSTDFTAQDGFTTVARKKRDKVVDKSLACQQTLLRTTGLP